MIRKILTSIFVNLFANGLSFLILIASARYYGTSGRGMIAYTFALAYFIGTLFSFTTGRTFIYFINNSKKDARSFYSEQFANILFLIISGVLLSLGCLILFFIFNKKNLSDFTYANYLWIFCLTITYVWQGYAKSIFASIDKINLLNSTTLFPNIFILILLIITLHYHFNLNTFIAAFTLANLASTLLQFYVFIRAIQPNWQLNLTAIKTLFKKSLILHIDSMGGYLFAAIYVPLSAHYLSLQEVGLLQLSQQIIAVFMAAPQILQLFIINKIAAEDQEAAWHFTLKLVKISIIYTIIIIILCLLFSHTLISNLFGQEFSDSAKYINLLSLTLFGNIVATLVNPFWIAKGLLIQQAFLTLFFGLTSLLLTIILLPHLGIYGIIIALISNYLIALIGNLIFLKYISPS